MNIRPIEESDLPALGRAYVESFREVDPSEEWTEERAVALLRFIYSKQSDLSFLVEENGEIGGGMITQRVTATNPIESNMLGLDLSICSTT
jgi:hypothetical protein